MITKRMLDLFKRPTDPPEYSYLYATPAALFAGALIWAAMDGSEQSGLVQAGYLISTLLSIGALTGLASQVSWIPLTMCRISTRRRDPQLTQQSTARIGNSLGMLGVFVGLLATLLAVGFTPEQTTQCAIVIAAGGALGLAIGRRVSPMQLPQTVAALHSVVGLAAVLTTAGSVMSH